ncbi:hypothetical protein Ancab_014398 [Ancistrocladus abbreviatus]
MWAQRSRLSRQAHGGIHAQSRNRAHRFTRGYKHKIELGVFYTKVNATAEVIYDLVDPGANLIFGAMIDPLESEKNRLETTSMVYTCDSMIQ